VFFAGLGVLIGGLEKAHVFEMLAQALAGAASSSRVDSSSRCNGDRAC
jgi:Na+/H+ antiporter NhaD/arsenite permease-like protein